MLFSRGKWILALAAFAACLALSAHGFAQDKGPRINDTPIPLSAEEKAWLDKHRDLRLGMWLGEPPVAFRGSDGSIQGIVPTFVNLITKKLGLKPKPIRASSCMAMRELSKAREVDMVAAITADPKQENNLLLSEPYLLMPIVIVTRSNFPFITGLDDLSGLTVAMRGGQLPHLCVSQQISGLNVLNVADPEQGLRAVESGRADAFVSAQPTVTYVSRKHGITNIRIAAMTQYSYRLSFGVRKDWPMLMHLVNRALASISEDERKSIHDYWTVLRGGQWVERPDVWRMVSGVIAAALAVLGLILFWNRRLAAEVRKRKRAEQKYRRAHEATQQIIESADIIIVGLDYTGHVRLLNSAGEAITGYSREELMGKDWFEMVVPRERFPYVWDEFHRLMREGAKPSTDTFENPILTKSGETRYILWRNSNPERNGGDKELATISFGTDITNRLQAEEQLRLTQFAMDNAAVGIFRVKPSAHIVYANRTASSMLGYTRSELKRLTVPDVNPAIPADKWPDFWERLKSRQMVIFEAMLQDKSGAMIPAEITAYHLLFKGTELAIGFFADISERKRMERLKEDVERMVRHDLRSPALAVHTLFRFLERADNLTNDQQELLASVKGSSERMLGIIDMSRAIYKMEEGTYQITPEEVDLLPLVTSVNGELRPLLRTRKVELVVNVEDEPAGVNGVFLIQSEEILCYALLANLLRNAVEASPEGGTVTLNLSTGSRHIISVHNPGVIPESIQGSFFEKYVTEGKTQGTGLGTYTARLVATSLGGDIAFTTSREGGTTITVSLPIENNTNS